MVSEKIELTLLLRRWGSGEDTVFTELENVIGARLKELASRKLRNESYASGLQTTELVHETYLSLFKFRHTDWNDRAHFFRFMAVAMKNCLIDLARKRRTLRHGGNIIHVNSEWEEARLSGSPDTLLAISKALEDLERRDPECVEIINLRFFAGFTVEETAKIMNIPSSTLNRRWTFARSWLLMWLHKK